MSDIKKLYRSRTDYVLGDVCGGIDAYYNWNIISYYFS